ncbi:MAG: arylsulfotransferase family protein [Albidovulum sp.]|uniref:arylsulfotransferase family protein n=1 Tax=Albidovulum sp. TaxID=1872424 RepID=UPI003C9B3391
MNAKILSILAGIFLAVLVAFLGGMWTTYKNWWPWQQVDEARVAWRSFRATGRIMPLDTYARRRPDAADTRHAIHDAQAAAPGYWVINRFDADTGTYVLELFDGQGALVNTHPIDYSRIKEGGDPGEFAHIATMLPDGSVVVVWDDAPGMARLDACGAPVWAKTDQIYHHSLERGVDGYWTWASAIWNGGEDQRMIRFDPETGDILESIDLIDDVILKSPANALALQVPEEFEFDRTTQYGDRADIFHPNDVEELLPEMAAAFPQFEAGDLLISNRNIDQVAVIGRKTGAVKWSAYGPWQHQHDADFLPDGTISIFSNNTDRFRSNIIRIDPKTGVSEDMFYGKGVDFDSFIMGKQQRLPNGNWLITATIQGRVLEVTPAGKIVREYNNIIDETYNALVLYAEYLPPDYLTTVPACAK